MIFKNETVEYRGRTYIVTEVGDDGSLALHPVIQLGLGWNRAFDFGEVEVDKINLSKVRVLYA